MSLVLLFQNKCLNFNVIILIAIHIFTGTKSNLASDLHYCEKCLLLILVLSNGPLLLYFQNRLMWKNFKHHSVRMKIINIYLLLKNINFQARSFVAFLPITAGSA